MEPRIGLIYRMTFIANVWVLHTSFGGEARDKVFKISCIVDLVGYISQTPRALDILLPIERAYTESIP